MTGKIPWRKPSLLFISITVIGFVFLSSLGMWQLQRAEEKKQILLDNTRKTNLAPQQLELPVDDPAKLRFKKIMMQGNYISARQFVLDNQVHDRKVGYNILTPFKLYDSTTVVLVDRGWVPQGQSRVDLPEISVDQGVRTIIGNVYVPFGDPYTLGEIDNGKTAWPRLIQYLDFAALEIRLEKELLPFTLRLESGQKDGYITSWPLFAFTPKRNLAYAVQWFALAVTLLIIFVVLHLPRQNKR